MWGATSGLLGLPSTGFVIQEIGKGACGGGVDTVYMLGVTNTAGSVKSAWRGGVASTCCLGDNTKAGLVSLVGEGVWVGVVPTGRPSVGVTAGTGPSIGKSV